MNAFLARVVDTFDFRQFITTLIATGFMVAFLRDPHDPGFKSTLQNVFVGAIAFWLGSSQGAHENRAELREHGDKLFSALAKPGDPA